MNVEAKPRRLSFRMLMKPPGMSVSYDFLYPRANQRATFLFTIVGGIIEIVT